MSTSGQLLTILRSTIRMMGTRGYNIKGYEEIEKFGAEDFTKTYGDSNPASYTSDPFRKFIIDNDRFTMRSMMSTILVNEKLGASCLIYFAPPTGSFNKKTSVGDPRIFLAAMNTILYDGINKCTHGIIITQSALTPQGLAMIKEFHESMRIQHFTDEDIQFDPTQHVYNPIARILTSTESNDFLRTNQIELAKMPRNLSDEPLAKYLGAMPRDIIEYERQTFLPEMLVDIEIFQRSVRRPVEKKKAERKR